MVDRPRGQAALAAVDDAGVLQVLAAFDPVVVGTFPLGLDRPGSDVDIVCCATDLDAFLAEVVPAFERWPGFTSHRRVSDDQPEAAVVRLMVGDVPIEIFAQPIPTARQRGYRHLTVERRLLELGGRELADRVRAARRDGVSVEVAFAEVLGLDGDPYLAVLALEDESDARLHERIRAAVRTDASAAADGRAAGRGL